jgi:hypothetical protein
MSDENTNLLTRSLVVEQMLERLAARRRVARQRRAVERGYRALARAVLAKDAAVAATSGKPDGLETRRAA